MRYFFQLAHIFRFSKVYSLRYNSLLNFDITSYKYLNTQDQKKERSYPTLDGVLADERLRKEVGVGPIGGDNRSQLRIDVRIDVGESEQQLLVVEDGLNGRMAAFQRLLRDPQLLVGSTTQFLDLEWFFNN